MTDQQKLSSRLIGHWIDILHCQLDKSLVKNDSYCEICTTSHDQSSSNHNELGVQSHLENMISILKKENDSCLYEVDSDENLEQSLQQLFDTVSKLDGHIDHCSTILLLLSITIREQSFRRNLHKSFERIINLYNTNKRDSSNQQRFIALSNQHLLTNIISPTTIYYDKKFIIIWLTKLIHEMKQLLDDEMITIDIITHLVPLAKWLVDIIAPSHSRDIVIVTNIHTLLDDGLTLLLSLVNDDDSDHDITTEYIGYLLVFQSYLISDTYLSCNLPSTYLYHYIHRLCQAPRSKLRILQSNTNINVMCKQCWDRGYLPLLERMMVTIDYAYYSEDMSDKASKHRNIVEFSTLLSTVTMIVKTIQDSTLCMISGTYDLTIKLTVNMTIKLCTSILYRLLSLFDFTDTFPLLTMGIGIRQCIYNVLMLMDTLLTISSPDEIQSSIITHSHDLSTIFVLLYCLTESIDLSESSNTTIDSSIHGVDMNQVIAYVVRILRRILTFNHNNSTLPDNVFKLLCNNELLQNHFQFIENPICGLTILVKLFHIITSSITYQTTSKTFNELFEELLYCYDRLLECIYYPRIDLSSITTILFKDPSDLSHHYPIFAIRLVSCLTYCYKNYHNVVTDVNSNQSVSSHSTSSYLRCVKYIIHIIKCLIDSRFDQSLDDGQIMPTLLSQLLQIGDVYDILMNILNTALHHCNIHLESSSEIDVLYNYSISIANDGMEILKCLHQYYQMFHMTLHHSDGLKYMKDGKLMPLVTIEIRSSLQQRYRLLIDILEFAQQQHIFTSQGFLGLNALTMLMNHLAIPSIPARYQSKEERKLILPFIEESCKFRQWLVECEDESGNERGDVDIIANIFSMDMNKDDSETTEYSIDVVMCCLKVLSSLFYFTDANSVEDDTLKTSLRTSSSQAYKQLRDYHLQSTCQFGESIINLLKTHWEKIKQQVDQLGDECDGIGFDSENYFQSINLLQAIGVFMVNIEREHATALEANPMDADGDENITDYVFPWSNSQVNQIWLQLWSYNQDSQNLISVITDVIVHVMIKNDAPKFYRELLCLDERSENDKQKEEKMIDMNKLIDLIYEAMDKYFDDGEGAMAMAHLVQHLTWQSPTVQGCFLQRTGAFRTEEEINDGRLWVDALHHFNYCAQAIEALSVATCGMLYNWSNYAKLGEVYEESETLESVHFDSVDNIFPGLISQWILIAQDPVHRAHFNTMDSIIPAFRDLIERTIKNKINKHGWIRDYDGFEEAIEGVINHYQSLQVMEDTPNNPQTEEEREEMIIEILNCAREIQQYLRVYSKRRFCDILENITIEESSRRIEDESEVELSVKWWEQGHASGHKQDLVPHAFICPITLKIMADPVLLSDGHSYERDAIVRWLQDSDRSPKTNQVLLNRYFFPNQALKMIIEEFVETKHGLYIKYHPFKSHEG